MIQEYSGEKNYTWGSMALYDAPDIIRAMHRRYVDAGADILLTDTFLFHRCVRLEIAGDVLELSSATVADQDQLIRLFVSRHAIGA